MAFAVSGGLNVAHAQTLDSSKSAVTITFKQMGVPVDAKFKKVAGQLTFDPANTATAKATVDIDVASFDLGDPLYNQEVLKKEWFDAAKYPKATFTSTAISPASNGRLDASGKLTIKGRTLDVKVPVTMKTEAGASVFEGALPIKRLAFNIGEGEWKDTSMVADEVIIKFKLVAPVGATTKK
ncbi:MAG TPA: YceI family protein [Burkholderiaceae bacterium]|nr:YceI family protein [Burkholderiaceae bacterium]